MAQTNKHKDGQCDSKTESAQWTNSLKKDNYIQLESRRQG